MSATAARGHAPWGAADDPVPGAQGEDAIRISYCQPFYRGDGWTYEERPDVADCTADAVNFFRYLYQAYVASDPHYTRNVTISVLLGEQTGTMVNNESSDIIRMLNSKFRAFVANDFDYYPVPLRREIDAINALVYRSINNGVYRVGFARSQAAYDEAYDDLSAALDRPEEEDLSITDDLANGRKRNITTRAS
jgi:putative glutathione S-transferase